MTSQPHVPVHSTKMSGVRFNAAEARLRWSAQTIFELQVKLTDDKIDFRGLSLHHQLVTRVVQTEAEEFWDQQPLAIIATEARARNLPYRGPGDAVHIRCNLARIDTQAEQLAKWACKTCFELKYFLLKRGVDHQASRKWDLINTVIEYEETAGPTQYPTDKTPAITTQHRAPTGLRITVPNVRGGRDLLSSNTVNNVNTRDLPYSPAPSTSRPERRQMQRLLSLSRADPTFSHETENGAEDDFGDNVEDNTQDSVEDNVEGNVKDNGKDNVHVDGEDDGKDDAEDNMGDDVGDDTGENGHDPRGELSPTASGDSDDSDVAKLLAELQAEKQLLDNVRSDISSTLKQQSHDADARIDLNDNHFDAARHPTEQTPVFRDRKVRISLPPVDLVTLYDQPTTGGQVTPVIVSPTTPIIPFSTPSGAEVTKPHTPVSSSASVSSLFSLSSQIARARLPSKSSSSPSPSPHNNNVNRVPFDLSFGLQSPFDKTNRRSLPPTALGPKPISVSDSTLTDVQDSEELRPILSLHAEMTTPSPDGQSSASDQDQALSTSSSETTATSTGSANEVVSSETRSANIDASNGAEIPKTSQKLSPPPGAGRQRPVRAAARAMMVKGAYRPENLRRRPAMR